MSKPQDGDQTFTPDDMEAALCAWEEILFHLRAAGRLDDKWQRYAATFGMATTRQWAIDHAREIDQAYLIAVEHGFDAPFDWEFVPEFLARSYDDELFLVPNWKDIAKAIGEKS